MNKLKSFEHMVFKIKIHHITLLGLLFIILCFANTFSQQEEPRELILRGSIVNEDGFRVSNIPIRFIMQKRGFNKTNSTIDILEEKEISTRSDSKGLFEIIWLEDASFNNFYLRFYREGEFDEVLYKIPEDVDITKQIKLSGTVKIDHMLEFNPQWESIKAEIEKVGAESDKGKTLRLRGIPDSLQKFNRKGLKNMEIWWYYSKGICYRFKGDQLEKVFRFNSSAVNNKAKDE